MILISFSESEKNVAQRKSESNVMIDETEQDLSSFPLAVKMMFNYDAESNATSILRAMYRETVPAQCHYTNEELIIWEKRWGRLPSLHQSSPPPVCFRISVLFV